MEPDLRWVMRNDWEISHPPVTAFGTHYLSYLPDSERQPQAATHFHQGADTGQPVAQIQHRTMSTSFNSSHSSGYSATSFGNTNPQSHRSFSDQPVYSPAQFIAYLQGNVAGPIVQELGSLGVVSVPQWYLPSSYRGVVSAPTSGYPLPITNTNTTFTPPLPQGLEMTGVQTSPVIPPHLVPDPCSPEIRVRCDYQDCRSKYTYTLDPKGYKLYEKHLERTHDPYGPYPCPKDGCEAKIQRIDNFRTHWLSKNCACYDSTTPRTPDEKKRYMKWFVRENGELHRDLLFRLQSLKRLLRVLGLEQRVLP